MSKEQGNGQFGEDREKLLVGGALLKAAKGNALMRVWVKALLDEHVTGAEDRAFIKAKGWL